MDLLSGLLFYQVDLLMNFDRSGTIKRWRGVISPNFLNFLLEIRPNCGTYLPPDFLDFSIDRLGISVKSGIRMTTLSLMPRVFRIEPLLSLPEARQIVTMARTRMEQRVANATPPQRNSH